MAKKEPNTPDDVKTAPANETPTEEQAAPVVEPLDVGSEAPAPELTADEAATLAHEGEAALRDTGEEQLEPPTPFDLGGEYIPDPADNVVPFDKIISKKQAAAQEAEQAATQEKGR